MSGTVKNRKRNQMISFWVSPDEKREIEARVMISGLPKGKFFIQSVLCQRINIAVGKYQSDRLSIEIRRLRESFDAAGTDEMEQTEALKDCRALIEQLIGIIGTQKEMKPVRDDFRSETDSDRKKYL